MAVLNKHRLPGKRIPEGAIYIGRGSRWGNPHVIGVDGTREAVIARYRQDLWDWVKKEPEQATKALAELHGKDLVCFCAPAPCHGDVLEKAAAWAHTLLQGKSQAMKDLAEKKNTSFIDIKLADLTDLDDIQGLPNIKE